MANNKDFILKNAIEVGGSTSMTIGSAPTVGSVTVGYDISNSVYQNKFGSTDAQTIEISGIYLKPDGTKMYISDIDTDKVFQYSLSTAWDVSTSSYDSKFVSTVGEDAYPNGIYFKSDGTKMWMIGGTTSMYQYTLTTAWDISTASYDSVSYNYDNDVNISGRCIFFRADGLKMYLLGTGNYDVLSYTLTTAWDFSTLSFDGTSACLALTSTVDTNPTGMYISDDGYALFILGSTGDAVYKIILSTAWDVSTGDTTSETSFSVSGEMTNPQGMTMGDSGTKVYALSSASGTSEGVYQYNSGSTLATNTFDVSTGNYFADTPSVSAQYDFSNAGDTQTFQLEVTGNQTVVGYDFANIASDSKTITISASTDSEALAFKPDGTVLYILSRQNSDTVRQYSLATAWDISTANTTATASKSVSEETQPQGMFFKPDGLKMYIVGYTTDTVREYPLTTAWDLSTAGSVSASKAVGISAPYGLTFKPDGTKFFVNASNNLYEFSMSTAWDIANATSVATSPAFSTAGGSSGSYDHVWNEDGTKFITASDGTNSLYEFTLATAWDVSSFSGTASAFAVPDGSTAVVYGNSGRKLYVNVSGSAIINQYSTASTTAITITWDADIQWAGGTAPDSPAANEKDLYTITTDDAGTSYVGIQSGDNFS